MSTPIRSPLWIGRFAANVWTPGLATLWAALPTPVYWLLPAGRRTRSANCPLVMVVTCHVVMVPLTGELACASGSARRTLAAVVLVPLAPYWELNALSGLPTVTVAPSAADAGDMARPAATAATDKIGSRLPNLTALQRSPRELRPLLPGSWCDLKPLLSVGAISIVGGRPAYFGRKAAVPLCMESSTPSRDTAWAMSEENVEVVRASTSRRIVEMTCRSKQKGREHALVLPL